MALPPPIKAFLFVLIAVFGSSAALFTADGWRGGGVWNVAVLAAGALGVWWTKNTPTQPWAKFLISLFTAGVAVLVSAWTDHRIDPVEVQQIVLAVLGVAVVGATNEARPAPAPTAVTGPVLSGDAAGSDSGRSRVVTALLLAVVALLAAAIPASAHRPDHHPRPAPAAVVVVAPRVSSVDACTGTLVVHFDTTTLTGHDWAPLMDDGTTLLELRETSGRSGPAGVWGPPPAELGAVASGGEHILRWPGWARAAGYGLHYTSARVVTGGYRSVAAPIELGCVE